MENREKRRNEAERGTAVILMSFLMNLLTYCCFINNAHRFVNLTCLSAVRVQDETTDKQVRLTNLWALSMKQQYVNKFTKNTSKLPPYLALPRLFFSPYFPFLLRFKRSLCAAACKIPPGDVHSKSERGSSKSQFYLGYTDYTFNCDNFTLTDFPGGH